MADAPRIPPAPLTGLRPGRVDVEQSGPTGPRPPPTATLPVIPKTSPEFEPNEAFADFDATMLKAVRSLQSVIKLAPFNGAITEAQLTELAKGKLKDELVANAKPLPPEWAELQNVALLLNTTQGKVFRDQLGNPINPTVLEAAPRVGFPKAHEVLLKARLTKLAEALPTVLKPLLNSNNTIDLNKLKGALNTGLIAGARVTDPALIDAMGLLADNRRLFATVGTMTPTQLKKLAAGEEVPHKDGTYDWKVKLSDVVSSTLPVKPGPEPTVDIRDPKWKTKIPVLLSEYQAFLKDRKMVAFHEAWHSKNGSGGVSGKAGDGEWFLHFHAHMGGDFIEWLKMRGKTDAALVKGANGEYALPDWADMTKDLPEGFSKPGQPNNIGWTVPPFLKRGTPSVAHRPFVLDGQKIASLDDIKTLDDLGRVMGESGAHAVAHVEFGDLMAGFKSVMDPRFIPWHYGTIEKIRHEWLKTENGKKWLAANPLGFSEPFLDTHDKVMGDVTKQKVEQITRALEEPPLPMVGATRGARGAPAMAAAPAPKRTRAQILREAKQLAEEICTSTEYNRGNAVLFTKDQILEAAAGFHKDSAKHVDGAERTERTRSRAARASREVTEPWGGEGRR